MLAGRMKLKHFLALVSLVGVAGVVGLVKACKSNEPPPRPEAVATRPSQTPSSPSNTGDGTRLAPRAHDADVLAWNGRSLRGDKGKDVSKGKPYKINVYQDAGKSTVNRAKVDLDRDDKWDEKYTFGDGRITLEIAPDDDENYTKTYHWTGAGWLPEGETPAGATTAEAAVERVSDPNAPTPDLPARPYDAEVLAWKDRSISGDKIKDASKGRPYKINVYMDAGRKTVNRAKVDVNRNDKWDEKYTFEPGKITLQRAPADDEKYTETYHWTGAGWTRAQ